MATAAAAAASPGCLTAAAPALLRRRPPPPLPGRHREPAGATGGRPGTAPCAPRPLPRSPPWGGGAVALRPEERARRSASCGRRGPAGAGPVPLGCALGANGSGGQGGAVWGERVPGARAGTGAVPGRCCRRRWPPPCLPEPSGSRYRRRLYKPLVLLDRPAFRIKTVAKDLHAHGMTPGAVRAITTTNKTKPLSPAQFISPGPFLLSTGLRVLQVTSLRLPLKSKVQDQVFFQNHHLHMPVFISSKPIGKLRLFSAKRL